MGNLHLSHTQPAPDRFAFRLDEKRLPPGLRSCGRPNNSLERTQPQREFMYDVEMLRRSARGRWAASFGLRDLPW
jgi:hypothetical protein